jgi:hypothetical protein
MTMDSISMCSNTLYMSDVDVGSSLSWLSALMLGDQQLRGPEGWRSDAQSE